MESREPKRMRLDHWKEVDLNVWDDFEDFMERVKSEDKKIALFSKKGRKPFWSMPSPERLFLVFGSEIKGLPESIQLDHSNNVDNIPITHKIRCLNLSTTVGIALYESLRFWQPEGTPL